MLTTNLALPFDPIYRTISQHFYENPDEFADVFVRALFKLTHRDIGPIARYLGPEAPKEEFIQQGLIPTVTHDLIDHQDTTALKRKNPCFGIICL